MYSKTKLVKTDDDLMAKLIDFSLTYKENELQTPRMTRCKSAKSYEKRKNSEVADAAPLGRTGVETVVSHRS